MKWSGQRGVIPVTPVSEFSTQDGKVARATTRHQGEESRHCVGPIGNSKPFENTHHQALATVPPTLRLH